MTVSRRGFLTGLGAAAAAAWVPSSWPEYVPFYKASELMQFNMIGAARQMGKPTIVAATLDMNLSITPEGGYVSFFDGVQWDMWKIVKSKTDLLEILGPEDD